jgi:hypothetical protein
MIAKFTADMPAKPQPPMWGVAGRVVEYCKPLHPFYGLTIEAEGHDVSVFVDRSGRLTRGWWSCSCGSRGRETDPGKAAYLAARHTGQQ